MDMRTTTTVWEKEKGSYNDVHCIFKSHTNINFTAQSYSMQWHWHSLQCMLWDGQRSGKMERWIKKTFLVMFSTLPHHGPQWAKLGMCQLIVRWYTEARLGTWDICPQLALNISLVSPDPHIDLPPQCSILPALTYLLQWRLDAPLVHTQVCLQFVLLVPAAGHCSCHTSRLGLALAELKFYQLKIQIG